MADAATSPLTISWRVSVAQYETDEAFGGLLALVRDNLDWLDEIALFETVTHHLYLPPEVLAERTAILGRRIAAMREAGVRSVGINVLTTIGHINEAWDTMAPLPFQPMVGHDGTVSRGCACPNTSGLREYVRAKYTMVAEAAPDFVWVDDDIRMNNHGVAWACFCPTCLAIVSRTLGQEFTRESLLAALGDPARGDVREAWVRQNADTVAGLLADVASAIDTVDPEIATGLMVAGPGDVYAGAALHRWMRRLRATKLRPGGGFYTDATPMAMVGKALDTGRGARVVADMPEVADIQYELEDFPYQKLRKSATALVAECTLALAAGCNGVALNMLPMWGGSLDEVEAFLPRLRAVRPEWEGLVAAAVGLPTAGLWPAWQPRILTRRLMRPGDGWFADTGAFGAGIPYLLAEIGLPLSVEPWDGAGQPACGAVLAGRMAEVFTDEELRAILSGGVLMDTAALDVLTERGLGDLAGVRVTRRIDNGAMEQFTEDALNGRHAGEVRDARIEFWGDARGKADVLEPLGDGVRMLAELRDYLRRPMGPCLSAYENRLGGRVVVMGYAQWMFVQSVPKRAQLLNVADWLTRGTLPVRVEEAVPLVPFARMPSDRSRAVVVLLNAGLDTLDRATVRIRLSDGERTETVADLAPWTTKVLVVG